MATARVSSEISAPVEHVFAIFTDIDHAPAYVSGIKQIEQLTPGGFGLGTRWRETRVVLGRVDDAEMEVTAIERNRRYTITHHKAGIRIDAEFSFEPTPAGTRVSIEFELGHGGLPPGLLTPVEWVIGSKVEEALKADLDDLKRSIETTAT